MLLLGTLLCVLPWKLAAAATKPALSVFSMDALGALLPYTTAAGEPLSPAPIP